MAFLKVFKQSFLDILVAQLSKGRGVELYDLDSPIPYEDDDVLTNYKINVPEEISLRIRKDRENFDFENAVLIHEYLMGLDPTTASDPRLWAYLSHVTFWKYMKNRWPVKESGSDSRNEHILKHWFIRNLSARGLVDNGIAVLWWGAYMTYDENRADKYELTRELFSMLDYTRTLITGSLGRDKKFLHAFLQYSIDNKEFFKKYKADKSRSFMRKMNFVAGYKAIGSQSEEEIMVNISKYKDKVSAEYPD